MSEELKKARELVRSQLTAFDRGILTITFTRESGFAHALRTLIAEARHD